MVLFKINITYNQPFSDHSYYTNLKYGIKPPKERMLLIFWPSAKTKMAPSSVFLSVSLT